MINEHALTATEVASMLHIGRNAVYALAKSGELHSYRLGRKLLFSTEDVNQYLAKVHTGEELALSTPQTSVAPLEDRYIIGGIGLPTVLITDRLQSLGLQISHETMTSYSALCGMYEQYCDAAVVHLFDQRTNSYNVPYVQRLIPGTPTIVFRLVQRRQGFIVAQGNPKKISTWGALLRANVRIANQQRGCSSRILLDEKIIALEARPSNVLGYETEFATDLLAAQAVASGASDVSIAHEQIAQQTPGVVFIPLQNEWIDFAVVKSDRTKELVSKTKVMLADNHFQAEFARITGGNANSMGAVIYEC